MVLALETVSRAPMADERILTTQSFRSVLEWVKETRCVSLSNTAFSLVKSIVHGPADKVGNLVLRVGSGKGVRVGRVERVLNSTL